METVTPEGVRTELEPVPLAFSDDYRLQVSCVTAYSAPKLSSSPWERGSEKVSYKNSRKFQRVLHKTSVGQNSLEPKS